MNRRCLPLAVIAILAGLQTWVGAQTPTAEQALQLKPMQKEVEYDRPAGSELKQCRVSAEELSGTSAWVVRGAGGEVLRRFVDSNSDNKVDQWRYYRNGVEVYRDMDEDFNGKADQYRWLGTAGIRWGMDENEDGKIDFWRQISPEEVSAEVVTAIQNRDARQFKNVLLSAEELSNLGLGRTLETKISERIEKAAGDFTRAIGSQKAIQKNTTWIDFGGLRPGTIPAGTDGSTQDVIVYENVVAMVETDGDPRQLPIGTLIKVDQGWRVIDLPLADGDAATPQFVFFEGTSQPFVDDAGQSGVSEQTQELVQKLEEIDRQLGATRDPDDLRKLNGQRADTLERLANAAVSETNRDMWLMQFADTVGSAAQSGTYPQGTRRLRELSRKLARESDNSDLISHMTFAYMSAEYAEKLQSENADFTEVQQSWLEQLEVFIDKFPESRDAPEAMLQLALAKEFAGEDREANRWYNKIVRDFEDSPLAAKAAGAKRRLESVGKPFSLSGSTVEGKSFDLARLKGNVVLVHYWATWCEPCKKDMDLLARLQKKLERSKFEIVGVNLDSQTDALARHFRTSRPRWTHLYEKGGLDSRLANEMGIFTLPVMLLVDERGRIVNRKIHGGELESEIEKLLK